MTNPNRSRFLGDEEESGPAGWAWGGPHGPGHRRPDPALRHRDRLDERQAELSRQLARAGASTGTTLDTRTLDREPFGFHDGISQPLIAGPAEGRPGRADGGRRRVHPRLPERLRAAHRPAAAARGRRIPAACCCRIRPDPARSTSAATAPTWSSASSNKTSTGSGGSSTPPPGARTAQTTPRPGTLAAKLVGRWPSGAPLVKAPDQDNPGLGPDNDFGYHDADPAGPGLPDRRAHPPGQPT